ncbi:hypothetical protein ACFX2C_044130 [Malus domestica]
MLRRFKLGSKKKWRTFASALPCADYHEFFEILVRMDDSDNLPNESEDDEDKNDSQKKDDKGKGISIPRPRKTHNFKKSGASSSSSSGGYSITGPRIGGGRFSGGPRFQRQMPVVLALRGAAVVIFVIMVSVGEVVVLVLLVGKWDIGLLSAPRVSRDRSRPLCHLQRRFSRALDRAVMASRVVVVPTTTRGMLLRMLPDLISIPRSLVLSRGIPRILGVILLIHLCQLVDLSGIREVNPVRGKLLLVVQDHRGSLVSQARDVLPKGEVIKAVEVVVDDSKLRGMLITSHCKRLRTIRT